MTTVHRQTQTLRPVTIAITLTSCVLILAVNWLDVFVDIRQAVTVTLGAICVTSAVVAWWTLPDWRRCGRVRLQKYQGDPLL